MNNSIKKSKRRTARLLVMTLTVTTCGLLPMAGCSEGGSAGAKATEHEPLTIVTCNTDYSAFEEELHKTYPEIKLEYVSYAGAGMTGYMYKSLEAGEGADIYTSSIMLPHDMQKEHLVDLSQQDYLSNYNTTELDHCRVDGGVYQIPSNLNIMGIYYNKTMFQKHGWSEPQSFEELEKLIPKIKKEGIVPAVGALNLTGMCFTYLTNTAQVTELHDVARQNFQDDFLSGKTTAAENLDETAAYMQKWIDCGMFRAEDTKTPDMDSQRDMFMKGGAAMYIAGAIGRFTENEDGTGDQFGIMPWLSETGDVNLYITVPSRYYSINKQLTEKGNEQKLKDAQKVLSFLATAEGQSALRGHTDRMLSSLKGSELEKDSPYYEVNQHIRDGYSTPQMYNGFEAVIVPTGEKIQQWIAGECTGGDVLEEMDRRQQQAMNHPEDGQLANVAETLSLSDTGRLVAAIMGKAAEADAAMVSLGGRHDGYENDTGVNSPLFFGRLTEIYGAYVLPKLANVHTLTMSGADIKALQASGFDKEKGKCGPWPYVLVMREGIALEDEKIYTVAINGEGCTEDVGKQFSEKDTGISMLNITLEYFRSHKTITKKDLNFN